MGLGRYGGKNSKRKRNKQRAEEVELAPRNWAPAGEEDAESSDDEDLISPPAGARRAASTPGTEVPPAIRALLEAAATADAPTKSAEKERELKNAQAERARTAEKSRDYWKELANERKDVINNLEQQIEGYKQQVEELAAGVTPGAGVPLLHWGRETRGARAASADRARGAGRR